MTRLPGNPIFRPATGFIAWVLRWQQAEAITMPWRTVYLKVDTPEVRAHELVHIEQIGRDGPVLFACRWLWWTWWYGYWANPYEIEASIRTGEFLRYFGETDENRDNEA